MHSTLRLISGAARSDETAALMASNALQGTGATAIVVQSYCNQVLKQPDINLSDLPEDVRNRLPPINDHLVLARGHAKDYLDRIQPRMIAVITDIHGYAQQFTSFYGLINRKLDEWGSGSPQAKKDALDLLTALRGDIGTRKQAASDVLSDLRTFRTNITGDAKNFNESVSKADIIIGGDQGYLKTLDKTIDELDSKIGGAIAGVALGGLAVVGGAFLIAVGGIASFVTAGTSSVLVGVGVVVLVGGVAATTASGIVLGNLVAQKGKLMEQREEIKAELKILKDLKGSIANLSGAISPAIEATTNMVNAWNILDGNMGNVIDAIDSARTSSSLPILVRAYLGTANEQWGTVQKNASTIEEQLSGVQTKEVPKLTKEVILTGKAA
jgi:hypothetical protein